MVQGIAMSTDTRYPRMKITERTEWYGACYDLEGWTGPKKANRVWLGRHDSKEAAESAFQRWRETGEKPPRRKYRSRHQERSSRVVERDGKWYAKGVEYTDGNRQHVHIGVFNTQQAAKEAADAFVATGARCVVQKEPKTKLAVLTREKKEKPVAVKPDGRKRDPEMFGFSINRCGTRFHPKARIREDGKYKYVHIGSFATEEEAKEAVQKFRKDGIKQLGNGLIQFGKEKPAKKERQRKASIQEGITRNGPTFYVTGRDTKNGKRIRVHVGTFGTRKQAEEAATKFIETGWTAPAKKRGPAVRLQDIRIAPGRNLRDHEVECLKRHRPELLGGDPRARRPDESVADWFRRLEVLKGYRAA